MFKKRCEETAETLVNAFEIAYAPKDCHIEKEKTYMDRNIIKRKITRRTFLKLSASAAAVVAASDLLSTAHGTSLVESAKAAGLMTQDAWYPGLCKMCMQGDCQTRVHVVDGVVVKVEGDPRAIQNVGTLCPRGNSAIMQMYDPYRVKAPMKRTNPTKGLKEDPAFVEITWDEAIQTVAARLKQNMDDTRKVAAVSGFGVNSIFLGNFEAAFGKNPIQDTPARFRLRLPPGRIHDQPERPGQCRGY